MECITNNPFRILGLYANANARDIQKKLSQINAFLNAGKPVVFGVDFPFLPRIDRKTDLVDSALAKIQLNQDRVLHSLFWFTNSSHVDEPAFNALETGQIDKAADIWSKVANSRESLHNYSSAFNNLGTLKLVKAFYSGALEIDGISEAIRIKLSLISSDYFQEYAKSITDETYKPDSKEIAKLFANSLLQHLEISLAQGKTTPQTMAKMFSMADPDTHDHIIQRLSSPLKDRLSKMIDKSRERRKTDAKKALDWGSLLFNDSLNDLKAFGDLVGSNSIEYQNIADKLADEILQCAIDHFSTHKDSGEYRFLDKSKAVIDSAKRLAVGPMVNQRIDENRRELIKWVEETPDRLKFESIKDDFLHILASVDKATKTEVSVDLARNLVAQNAPRLERIKTRVGSSDETYTNSCSMVANVALQVLVTINNNYQEAIMRTNPYARGMLLENYKSDLKLAWEVFPLIEELAMDGSIRQRVLQNKQTMKEIMTSLGINPEGIMNSLKKFFFEYT